MNKGTPGGIRRRLQRETPRSSAAVPPATHTSVAPYLGTPKLARATFNLRQGTASQLGPTTFLSCRSARNRRPPALVVGRVHNLRQTASKGVQCCFGCWAGPETPEQGLTFMPPSSTSNEAPARHARHHKVTAPSSARCSILPGSTNHPRVHRVSSQRVSNDSIFVWRVLIQCGVDLPSR